MTTDSTNIDWDAICPPLTEPIRCDLFHLPLKLLRQTDETLERLGYQASACPSTIVPEDVTAIRLTATISDRERGRIFRFAITFSAYHTPRSRWEYEVNFWHRLLKRSHNFQTESEFPYDDEENVIRFDPAWIEAFVAEMEPLESARQLEDIRKAKLRNFANIENSAQIEKMKKGKARQLNHFDF